RRVRGGQDARARCADPLQSGAPAPRSRRCSSRPGRVACCSPAGGSRNFWPRGAGERMCAADAQAPPGGTITEGGATVVLPLTALTPMLTSLRDDEGGRVERVAAPGEDGGLAGQGRKGARRDPGGDYPGAPRRPRTRAGAP